MKTPCNALQVAPDITLYHTGPALDHGPLPSVFYFAISGPDSLCLDPFNQMITFLKPKMVRAFSLTLPGHEADLPAAGAMKIWAEDFQKNPRFLDPFFDQLSSALEFAIKEKFVEPNHLYIAGLSRGAFVASHFAAKEKRIQKLLCFAPLTTLSYIQEFQDLREERLVDSYDLVHLAKELGDRHVRIYIGNEDTRVGTKKCFDFTMALVKNKQQRVSQTELFLYPSIGHKGHGTPPEVFQAGANWLFP